jgi:hypothetical protein
VTPGIDPLDASMLRLRALLDTSAPCLSCDATHESVVMGLVRYLLLPAAPPELDEAGHLVSDSRCADAPPDQEHRCRR